MKKILTSLTLLGAVAGGAYAQQYVDLGADPVTIENQVMPATGKGLTFTGIIDNNPAPADSIQAAILFYVGSNGGSLPAGEEFFWADPMSSVGSDGLSGWRGGAFDDDVDTGSYMLLDTRLTATDSIQSLLNIANFEADSSSFSDLVVNRADLQDGQTYGWYAYISVYPFDDADYADTSRANNFTYVPVIWQNSTTSIKDLLGNTKYTPLDIYPNPTTETISFKLEFSKSNKSTVARVIDVTGRVLSTVSFGNSNPGIREYNVNVSDLVPGNYSLQVITDHNISVEKFVKK